MNGDFIKEQQRLVSPKAEGQLASPIKFTEFQRKILDLICSSPGAAVDAHKCEIMVIKLRKDPVARSRLENIHSARAHRYGAAYFGPKFWNKENPAIAKSSNHKLTGKNFVKGYEPT